MSYMTGRPHGALPSIVPGFGCSTCAMGADEAAQRSPAVLIAALAGLAAGVLWSKRARR